MPSCPRAMLCLLLILPLIAMAIIGCGDDDDPTSSGPVIPGDSWTLQTSRSGSYLTAVTFNGTRYVAVGLSGTIVTSENGDVWSRRESPVNVDLLGVAAAPEGAVVAVGNNGVILESDDGLTWTEIDSPTENWLHGVVYADGMFIAGGAVGTFVYSTDTTWQLGENTSFNDIYDITVQGQQYVAVGTNEILLSNNGTQWQDTLSQPGFVLHGVAASPERFVAVGQSGAIFTSDDGTAWTRQLSGLGIYFYEIAYANDQFVAVGENGQIVTSPEGLVWTLRQSSATDHLRGLIYNDNQPLIVAVGNNDNIVTSSDGIAWTSNATGNSRTLRSIVQFDTLLIAVGDTGAIVTSEDTELWSAQISGVEADLFDATVFDNQVYAVGSDGTVIRSADGMSWDSVASFTASSIYGVTASSSRMVTVGRSGQIHYSDDGTTFNEVVPLLPGDWRAVTYANGKFVAVGEFGEVYSSSDGISWTPENSPTDLTLYGIGANDTLLVAVGDSGVIMTRPLIGNEWTLVDESSTTDALKDIAWSGERFVTVGDMVGENDVFAYNIVVSDNALEWSSRNLSGAVDLHSVLWNGERFVAVGEFGIIRTSP